MSPRRPQHHVGDQLDIFGFAHPVDQYGHPLGPGERLARNDDPDTSHAAARNLNLRLRQSDAVALRWVMTTAPGAVATYDEMATALVEAGQYERHEQARRRVRVLIEEYGLMELAHDDAGHVIRHTNASGAEAQCWQLNAEGRRWMAQLQPV